MKVPEIAQTPSHGEREKSGKIFGFGGYKEFLVSDVRWRRFCCGNVSLIRISNPLGMPSSLELF